MGLFHIIGSIGGEEGYPERRTTDKLWGELYKLLGSRGIVLNNPRELRTPFVHIDLKRCK